MRKFSSPARAIMDSTVEAPIQTHIDAGLRSNGQQADPSPPIGHRHSNGTRTPAVNGTKAGHEDRKLAPIEATEAYKPYPIAYQLSQTPFLYPRRLKVIVAGAGASALSFAHEVESGKLRNIDLEIFEKNAGLGGTWFENRYPGCACDIPAHAYLVTSAPLW